MSVHVLEVDAVEGGGGDDVSKDVVAHAKGVEDALVRIRQRIAATQQQYAERLSSQVRVRSRDVISSPNTIRRGFTLYCQSLSESLDALGQSQATSNSEHRETLGSDASCPRIDDEIMEASAMAQVNTLLSLLSQSEEHVQAFLATLESPLDKVFNIWKEIQFDCAPETDWETNMLMRLERLEPQALSTERMVRVRGRLRARQTTAAGSVTRKRSGTGAVANALWRGVRKELEQQLWDPAHLYARALRSRARGAKQGEAVGFMQLLGSGDLSELSVDGVTSGDNDDGDQLHTARSGAVVGLGSPRDLASESPRKGIGSDNPAIRGEGAARKVAAPVPRGSAAGFLAYTKASIAEPEAEVGAQKAQRSPRRWKRNGRAKLLLSPRSKNPKSNPVGPLPPVKEALPSTEDAAAAAPVTPRTRLRLRRRRSQSVTKLLRGGSKSPRGESPRGTVVDPHRSQSSNYGDVLREKKARSKKTPSIRRRVYAKDTSLPDSDGVCIVCIDACGDEAYAALKTLCRLAEQVPSFLSRVDVFAGSGSGSIVAALLAVQRYSVTQLPSVFQHIYEACNDDSVSLAQRVRRKLTALRDAFGELRMCDLPRGVALAALHVTPRNQVHTVMMQNVVPDSGTEEELVYRAVAKASARAPKDPAINGFLSAGDTVPNVCLSVCALLEPMLPGASCKCCRVLNVSGDAGPSGEPLLSPEHGKRLQEDLGTMMHVWQGPSDASLAVVRHRALMDATVSRMTTTFGARYHRLVVSAPANVEGELAQWQLQDKRVMQTPLDEAEAFIRSWSAEAK